MPMKAPRLCRCGKTVPSGARCTCQAVVDAERKARFDTKRPNSSARGYSRAWEKARAAYLSKHPFCKRCGKPAALVDHVIAHKGDKGLFWDSANWQALCTPCHSGAKQSAERRTERR